MPDINVICELYELDDIPFESEVYAIDSRKDRFLIVDMYNHFHWVSITDCTLIRS